MLSAPLILPRAMRGTAISDSGSGGVPFDEPDARVEVGAVREHRLAVVDGPARDAQPEGERLVGEHLVRVLAACEDAAQQAVGLVGLVEREVVVRDQLGDRVRDPLEHRVERLLGEHVVEDVGEPAVRLDEREGCRGVAVAAGAGASRGR